MMIAKHFFVIASKYHVIHRGKCIYQFSPLLIVPQPKCCLYAGALLYDNLQLPFWFAENILQVVEVHFLNPDFRDVDVMVSPIIARPLSEKRKTNIDRKIIAT